MRPFCLILWKYQVNYLKFEVLIALRMLIMVFCIVTLCSLVGGYQRLRGK